MLHTYIRIPCWDVMLAKLTLIKINRCSYNKYNKKPVLSSLFPRWLPRLYTSSYIFFSIPSPALSLAEPTHDLYPNFPLELLNRITVKNSCKSIVEVLCHFILSVSLSLTALCLEELIFLSGTSSLFSDICWITCVCWCQHFAGLFEILHYCGSFH